MSPNSKNGFPMRANKYGQGPAIKIQSFSSVQSSLEKQNQRQSEQFRAESNIYFTKRRHNREHSNRGRQSQANSSKLSQFPQIKSNLQ